MLRAVLEAFSEFTKRVAYTKLSIINQYWEDGRPINTYGSSYGEVRRFDRRLLEDLDYEVTIINSDDMETAATVSNQVALQIFEKGAIDAQALLQVGNWPQQFKEKALKVIAEQKAAMMQQQADAQQLAALQQGLPQQQAQQIGNGLMSGAMKPIKQAA